MVNSLNYLSVKPVLHNWYNSDGNVLFNIDSVAGDIALVIECFGVSYNGFLRFIYHGELIELFVSQASAPQLV